MQLHDARGRLYLTGDERAAFLAAAAHAAPTRARRPRRPGGVFETLKKGRRGVYRAVPVPAGLPLDQLDFVHGLREAQRRGNGHADRPLWPWSRMTAWRQVKSVIAAAGIPAGPHPQGPAAGDYVRQNGLRPSCQASAELRPMSLSA